MVNRPTVMKSPINSMPVPMVLAQRSVQRCHIDLPGVPRPTSAIVHNGQYYAYVRFFPTLEAAKRPVERLIAKGNAVILTKVPKGFVLWVLEPDAQPATKH
jgi:hypothetical protein